MPSIDDSDRLLAELGASERLPPGSLAPHLVECLTRVLDFRRPAAEELPELDRMMQGVFVLVFPHDGSDLERHVGACLRAIATAGPESWNKMTAALLTIPEVYGPTLNGGARALLSLFHRWIYARSRYTHTFDAWATRRSANPLAQTVLDELPLGPYAHDVLHRTLKRWSPSG